MPQTDYTSNLFPEAIPQSYSPKRLPKVAPQSCCRKLLPKVAFKSYSPKVFPFQSCCSKLPCKAAPQTCSTKLFPKAFPKVVIGSGQLLKLPPKVVSESGFPKLLSKVTPQSPKLSFFKATVRQCFCKAAKLLPTVAPQSCSSKLLPKAASQTSPQKLQSCSPKLPQSWSGKLSKAAPANYCERLRTVQDTGATCSKHHPTPSPAVEREACARHSGKEMGGGRSLTSRHMFSFKKSLRAHALYITTTSFQ